MTGENGTPQTDEIIEGDAVEIPPASLTAVAVRPALEVTPTVKASELVERLDVIRQAAEQAMTDGVDYGKVPGTDKPTLFKPGAEKLSVLFQLDVQLQNEKLWDGLHLTVVSHATVYHAPTGSRLGYGEGVCTTRERKYAFRKQERVCPNCNMTAVIKGKAEYGGGWLCWSKKGGCNSKWPDGADVIESQPVGEIENPDLPDLWNTVVKMAEKRARVDAVLAVTGASALFTQDMEDAAPAVAPEPASAPPDPEPELVTPEDIKALQAAANGLRGPQIKLAMGAAGVPIPDPFVWNRVPRDKAAELATKLAEIERPS